MNRHRGFQVLLLAVAAVLIVAAGPFRTTIEGRRRQADEALGTGETPEVPKLRLVQAAPGIVRALLIDYLWIRSEQMKMQGQFHDAEQITAAICTLQPRFPAVWRNRAWNLAYNISVKAHTAPERWHWVTRGVSLLRDEGLKYNPKSLELYLELSWIYQHKMGETIDDMHWAYKRYHASDVHRVLGAPPLPSRDAEESVRRYETWFRPIVDAPDTKADLTADPRVAAFVATLEELDVQLGLETLDVYNTWSGDPQVRVMDHPGFTPGNETQQRLQTLMTNPEAAPARDKVIAFSRRKVLIETFRMQPGWMLHMVSEYGPLDWRTVWAHSLYWASYGLHNCKGLDLGHVDPINTGRIVLTNLKNLISYGQVSLWFDPQNPSLPLLRHRMDWRFIDICQQVHLAMGDFYAGQEDGNSESTLGKFMVGHENWLRQVVQLLYLAGQMDKADEYLRYLRAHYGPRDPRLYALDVDQFVTQSINRLGLTQRMTAHGFVGAMISEAYQDVAQGQDADFQERIDRARYFWSSWNELVEGDTRKVLDDFDNIQADWAAMTLVHTDLAGAMSIWDYLPLPVQQRAYDRLEMVYRPLCERRNIDFDRAFPEPPGLVAFRERQQRLQLQQAAPGQDAGQPWRITMPD